MNQPPSGQDPLDVFDDLLGECEQESHDLFTEGRRYAGKAAGNMRGYCDADDVISQTFLQFLINQSDPTTALPWRKALAKATGQAKGKATGRERQRRHRERLGEQEGKPKKYTEQRPLIGEYEDKKSSYAIRQWDLEHDFDQVTNGLSDREKDVLRGKMEGGSDTSIREALGLTRYEFDETLKRVKQRIRPIIFDLD